MRYTVPAVALLAGALVGRMSTWIPVAAQVSEDSPSVILGTVPLKLGASQDKVLSQFGSEYKLSQSATPGLFVVSLKPADASQLYQLLGSLIFANGRLRYVTKDWVSDQHNIEAFWNGLFNSIGNLIDQTPISAAIEKDVRASQVGKQESLDVILKGRKITIGKYENFQNPKTTSYIVTETFGR
jgi:hypothetical protein